MKDQTLHCGINMYAVEKLPLEPKPVPLIPSVDGGLVSLPPNYCIWHLKIGLDLWVRAKRTAVNHGDTYSSYVSNGTLRHKISPNY